MKIDADITEKRDIFKSFHVNFTHFLSTLRCKSGEYNLFISQIVRALNSELTTRQEKRKT